MKIVPGSFVFASLLLSGSLGLFCYGQSAYGQQRFDLFSGVSFHQQAANGGNASLTFKLTPRFSLVADFSAHQESSPGALSTDILHGLFGGQFSLGEFAGLRPFARMTSGVTYWGRERPADVLYPDSDRGTGIVFGLGGGIDYPGSGLLDLRLLQVDYLTNPDWREGADVRVSFGVIVSF
jgi:hypothetical protein